MKFVPKEADGAVNISKTHPLAEMAWLGGGLFLLAALVYLGLTLLTGWIVHHLPVDAEVWIGKEILQQEPGIPSPPLKKRLDALVECLPQGSPLKRYDFSVRLIESDTVNAVALPGGTIVVFSGLLKEVASENELSMILAHELGHFAHRDHLKRLGKGIILGAASWLLFKNSSQPFLFTFVSGLDARYSQSQEEDADMWGLHLLYRRYGHVGGSVDFFARLLKKKRQGRLAYLFASHPHPQKRIERLVAVAREQKYPVKAVEPLGSDIQNLLEDLNRE